MPTLELVATDPARVGPYRLLRRLGSGGMGVVYLADTEAGGLVAVKCLPAGVSVEVRDRLHREATYLARVRHPRVAAFVAADTNADRPWIAMQYVAGPSLAQASVPLGPAQLRHLAEGLADALDALHRQGLTHRDVKPGNVILTHDGPVLVDLGIALGSDLTALTAVGMVVGTPEWMAPEQLSGAGSSHAIDTWGWAAVVAFAATGRPPFGTGPIEALAHRIRFEEPDLRGAPDWARGALLAGFAKDARTRPTSAQLAGVDGIRRVGAVALSPPAPAAPTPRAAPPTRVATAPPMPLPPPMPFPPVVSRPVQDVAPRVPRAPQHQPAAWPVQASVREAARARKGVKVPAPAKQPKQPKQPKPPRRRRGFVHRLLRRVIVLLLLVVVTVAVAGAAYSAIRAQLGHISWARSVDEVRDQVTRLVGG